MPASASNEDFENNSRPDLHFNRQKNPEKIVIRTKDDSIIETEEVFFVSLSTTSQNVRIHKGITVVTIIDNDGE